MDRFGMAFFSQANVDKLPLIEPRQYEESYVFRFFPLHGGRRRVKNEGISPNFQLRFGYEAKF